MPVLDELRSMTRPRLSRWLAYGEDGIYLAAGGLLGVTAVVVLGSALQVFWQAAWAGQLLEHSVAILDAVLLVLLIVEIMHTIRVSIVEHQLLAEPFLLVALIAGVRRVLILLVEAGEYLPDHPERFERVLLEMGLLIGFFVVIVASIAVLRRFGRS